MKNKILIWSFILFFVFIFSIFFSIINMGNTNIFSKIYINNINVSSRSKDDANKLLNNLKDKKINKKIKLKYSSKDSSNDYEYTLDLSTLNIEYNIEESVGKAYSLGKTGNIFQNNFTILKLLIIGEKIKTQSTYDSQIVEKVFSDISSNLPNKLVQSGYSIEDDELVITKGSAGIDIDKQAFEEKLLNYINDFSSDETILEIPTKYIEPEKIDLDKIHSEIYKEKADAYYEKDPFKVHPEIQGVDFDVDKAKKFIQEHPDDEEYSLALKITKPEVTTSDLQIDVFPDLLGSFSTRFNATNENRSTNLELAAEKIDGTIIAPGETFSYNKVVGARTIQAGYKEATIFSGNQIIPGIGGGICQISTTLYNAAMFANLDIVERYNHQFLISYVKPGRDATVSYGSVDLKFKNNRTYPIKISMSANSGVAKASIYGIKEKTEYEISFETEIVDEKEFTTTYKTDDSLPDGYTIQTGVDGLTVDVYKVTKLAGNVISKKFIYRDKYNPIDEVISKKSESADDDSAKSDNSSEKETNTSSNTIDPQNKIENINSTNTTNITADNSTNETN